MIRIVFICGFKRSGKDTLAKYLENNHDYIHLKISKPLKDATKILFNLADEQLEEDKKDLIDQRWNVTPRDIMKYLGTDVFQYKINDLLPNTKRMFWINHLFNEIENKYMNSTEPVKIAISDLRFNHEYNAISDFEFKHKDKVKIKIIKIARIGGEHRYFQQDTHESETQHLNFNYDMIIDNVQDRQDEFFKKIEIIAKTI